MSKSLWLVSILGAMAVASQVAKGDDTKAARHEVFDGYFVSNKFEPDAAESFVAISGQKEFDEVFGVAFVMGDKAHRLPKDSALSHFVLCKDVNSTLRNSIGVPSDCRLIAP